MYEHIVLLDAHIDMTGISNACKMELITNLANICETYKVKAKFDLPQLGNIKFTSQADGAVDSISDTPL